MARLRNPTLLALLLASVTAFAQPAPPAPSALSPESAIVAQRMAAFPLDRGVEAVEAYLPAQTVAGVKARPLPQTTAAKAGIDPAALEAAAALAEAKASHALIVMRRGRVVLARYWNGFGPSSRFSTASMHKTVLALAYGPAIAAGRISPADPIGRHLPEWRADARGLVTVEQALGMASGLAFPAAPPGPAAPGLRMMFAPDIRAVALSVPVAVPPGTVFAYSNVDSQLAGEALTGAIGGDYAAWLSQRIWKPIGAADAGLWMDREGGSPHYFCCLQARAEDWARVGELIRNQGKVGRRQVVPADWIARMTAPSALNPNFGLNLWRGAPHAPVRRYSQSISMTIPATEPFARDDVIFSDGAGGQRVYVSPSAGLVIVRIGRPSPDWDDSALPNILFKGLRD